MNFQRFLEESFSNNNDNNTSLIIHENYQKYCYCLTMYLLHIARCTFANHKQEKIHIHINYYQLFIQILTTKKVT